MKQTDPAAVSLLPLVINGMGDEVEHGDQVVEQEASASAKDTFDVSGCHVE